MIWLMVGLFGPRAVVGLFGPRAVVELRWTDGWFRFGVSVWKDMKVYFGSA